MIFLKYDPRTGAFTFTGAQMARAIQAEYDAAGQVDDAVSRRGGWEKLGLDLQVRLKQRFRDLADGE